MTGFLLNWLIVSVAVWLTATVVPGVQVKSFGSAVGVAAVFGVLNFLLGWLLFVVFSIGTLGLGYLFAFITWWIVDALLLKLTDALSDSLKIDGFLSALIASAAIAMFTAVGHWVVGLV